MDNRSRSGVAGLVMLGVATLLEPSAAKACGGFFCSQTPVVQNGEQIVFAMGDGHVTAHIRIFYTGEAKKFAWVVPVPTVPRLGVGTEQLFTQLAVATQPQFRLTWSAEALGCGRQPFNGAFADAGSTASGGSSGSGVQVLLEQEVGPYDAKVIESTDADALIKWLNENGYDQPPSALPFIQHYVDRKMKFVAIKLQNDAQVGDITPLVLDLDEPDPCVPLVLTRVAATPDMPVFVYVLGSSRVVPKNWFHVEVNPRKIDWLRGGANYTALATAAIDEAAGHGFLTEFAGFTPNQLRNAVWSPGFATNLPTLRVMTDPIALVNLALRSVPPGSNAALISLLRRFVPMPQSLRDRGVPENAFYSFIESYRADLAGQTVDGAGFTAALEERILTPAKNAQLILDGHPYLTRLFSTVSPDEMTRDPLFSQRSDLPTVSNVFTATGTGHCVDGLLHDATVTLPSGERVGFAKPFTIFNPPAWTAAANEPDAEHIAFLAPQQPPAYLTLTQAAVADGLLQTMAPETLRPTDFGPAALGGMADTRARTPSNLSATFPPGWDPGALPPVMVENPDQSPDGIGGGGGCGCHVGRANRGRTSWPGLLAGVIALGWCRRRAHKRRAS